MLREKKSFDKVYNVCIIDIQKKNNEETESENRV